MTRSRGNLRSYAICAPGLERFVASELAALGIATGRIDRGGVTFRATTRQLYAANLWSRVSGRILVRLGAFTARTFASLERQAEELNWPDYVGGADPVGFRVTARKSALYHTGAVAERLAQLLGKQPLRASEAIRNRGLLVVVRIDHDRVTISIDSSGAPLHQRGWRLDGAKAPMRETLAAAILAAAGWDGTRPLVDPFCGSGTLPIEAALLARNLAPGANREFAFTRWPSFEPGTWASVREEARLAARAKAGIPIVAADRDMDALDATITNAARAGVSTDLEVRQSQVSELSPPTGSSPGLFASNPPYGRRLSGGTDLRRLYRAIGRVAHDRFPGWSVGLLVANRALGQATGLNLDVAFRSVNGGVPVWFLQSTDASRVAVPPSR
ncbi:MAG: class I SAM-dependent RNA methyltransferase [Acidimicrobiales bacterium]|nr:class I SAM-dependent RNA methyltransferase [Acidimicrobiales bacterium]